MKKLHPEDGSNPANPPGAGAGNRPAALPRQNRPAHLEGIDEAAGDPEISA
jgi:hypothetical protein